MMISYKRQNPLLSEMVISLLFFSVCACIIICVFVSAYKQSEGATSRQEALIYAQSVAEDFKASDTGFSQYFVDKGWTGAADCFSTNAHFSRTDYSFTVTEVSGFSHIRGFSIKAEAGGETSFSFNVEVYCDE